MMLRSRPALTALGALGCTVSLVACGGFDSAASGERVIKDYFKKFGQGRVSVTSVSCPGGVEQKPGRSYDCKVALRDTAAGTDHSGTITIHIDKGNKVEINGVTDIHVQ